MLSKVGTFLVLASALYSANAATTVTVASKTNTVFAKPDYQCTGTNDNVQLQQAVDFVRAKGGGVILLSNGLFNMSVNLYLYSNMVFKGQGRDATVLQLDPAAPQFAKAGFVRSMNCANLEIRDMTLNGNKDLAPKLDTLNYGRFGVFTEACNDTIFDNLKITNWYGYGFDPHGEGGVYRPSRRVTITNSEASFNGWDGITVDKCEDSIVANNRVFGNGRHGINIVTGSKFVDVHDNYIKDNGYNYKGAPNGCGIMIQNNQGYGTRDVVLAHNEIVNAYKGGLCLTDVFNIDFNNNKILQTNICLRVKTITSLAANNIQIVNNVCSGTVSVKSDTTGFDGVAPVWLPYLSDKPVYVVASAGSAEAADFVCTGVNDETTIMKAMTYLGTNGGTIQLTAGIFNINKNLFLSSNVILQGQGLDVTILKLKDNADVWKVGGKSYAGMIRGMNINNVIVRAITLDGNRQNQPNDEAYNYGKYGFYCEVCNNVLLDTVKVVNHWGYGIDPHGTQSTNAYSDGFVIQNSEVAWNGWDGVTIDQTVNVAVKSNYVHDNGRHGINIVTGSKAVKISDNIIDKNGFYYYTGSKGCGIAYQNNGLFGTSDIEAVNNKITASATSSICIRNSDNTRFISNVIDGTSNCMRFQDSDQIYLESNTCLNSRRIKIEAADTTLLSVTLVNQTGIVYQNVSAI